MYSRKIIFRLDDISYSSDLILEGNIIDAFLSRHLPLTLGVIPFECAGDVHDPSPQKGKSLTKEKIKSLVSLYNNGVEIAQHGTSHQFNGVNAFSELFGLTFEEQLRAICKGKEFLNEYFPVSTFIPPWNSYDLATIKVLQVLGFRTISGDRYGPVEPQQTLQHIPCTVTLRAINNAVKMLKARDFSRKVIVVLMHVYDFHESNSGKSFMSLLHLNRILNNIPFGKKLKCTTIEECSKMGFYTAKSFIRGNQRTYLERIASRIAMRKDPFEGVCFFPKTK